MSGIETADARLTAEAVPSAYRPEGVSETPAERAGAWAFEFTGDGLPEEVAYNEYLLVVIQAEDSHRSLKAQLQATRSELAIAQSALDELGAALALEPENSGADRAFREGTHRVQQLEARIRAYETVVLPGAADRLAEAEARRRDLRMAVATARAKRELQFYLHYLKIWETQLAQAAFTLTQLQEYERRFMGHLSDFRDFSPTSPRAYLARELLTHSELVSRASSPFVQLFQDAQPLSPWTVGRSLIEIAQGRANFHMPQRTEIKATEGPEGGAQPAGGAGQ